MQDESDEISRIRTILSEHPKGLTIDDISKKLPLNRTSTAKYLNTLHISGQADMRTFGRAKVFTLSHRLPFSQMINFSSDLLLVLDDKLSIIQVNEPFLKLFGLILTELEGVQIEKSQLVTFFSVANINHIKEAAKGNEFTKIDSININEQMYYFKIKMIPVVFDRGGQGLAVIFEDITELKNYQQHLEQLVEDRTIELINTNEQLLKEIEQRQKSRIALEQSEKKYRELVEHANSIILRINNQGIITFFNEFAVTFFGFSEREMVGKNVFGTIIPFPDTPINDPMELILSLLKPTEYITFNEIECIRKNGDPVWVAWTKKVIQDEKGDFLEYLLVGMDITDRRQMENALHQVNTKLNLVSSIARHDILNKLTVIYSIIFLLKESITNSTCLEYLKQAEESAIAIKRQIEFTRDYKNMGIENADWQNVADSVRKSLANRDLKSIALDIPTNGLEIFADPWITKVFFNLIDNTFRHSESATKITVSYHAYDEGLILSFKDNGVGIPLHEKEKIFERGYGKNNGYGLFIAREILAITGLSIHETGDVGAGAQFEIKVPKRAYRIRDGLS